MIGHVNGALHSLLVFNILAWWAQPTLPMDGKAKKRLEVIKQKLQLLRQKLAGAKKQDDEPGEVRNLEKEIAALEAEATKLRA